MNNTKELPILFSTAMVRAILDNRKTMTRRVMKPQPVKNGSFYEWAGAGWSTEGPVTPVLGPSLSERCPNGRPGDILWVRETHYAGYALDEYDNIPEGAGLNYWYFADTQDDRPGNVSEAWCMNMYGADKKLWPKWKPSIHMPKEAARIWLRVTSVRVERLQDISEEDAKAEGIHNPPIGYIPAAQNMGIHRYGFANLWSEIYGKESWDTNPWVWVVEFEVISATGKPDNI